MKMQLKVLFLLIVVLISLTAQSQTYGFKTGLVLGNSKLSYLEDSEYKQKMSPGFHGGLVLEFPVSNSIVFETGINFTTKGTRIVLSEENYELDYKYVFYNLELPARLKVFILSLQNSKVHLSFGTYFGVARDGKLSGTETYYDESYSGEMYLDIGKDKDENEFRRFETGLSLGIGLQKGPVQLHVGYDIGFTDITHYEDSEDYMKHRALTLTVGYVFGDFKKSTD